MNEELLRRSINLATETLGERDLSAWKLDKMVKALENTTDIASMEKALKLLLDLLDE